MGQFAIRDNSESVNGLLTIGGVKRVSAAVML